MKSSETKRRVVTDSLEAPEDLEASLDITKITPSKRKKTEHKTKKDLYFRSSDHTYWLEGVKLQSVNEWLTARFVPEFKSKEKAIGSYEKNVRYNKATLKPQELMKYWELNKERAASLGTAAHLFGEMYDMDPTTKPVYGKEFAVKKFIDDYRPLIRSYSNEIKVFSRARGKAGTIDKFIKMEDGRVVLADYKTSTGMFSWFGSYLFKEMKDWKDTKYNKYSIQLNTYRILFEEMTGIPVDNLWIVHLESTGNYKIYECMDMEREVERALNEETDFKLML